MYSALRNVTRTLFLPFFRHPSLIFSVCPSFAPSASSALLVGLARSIQFTFSFFPTKLESAPNKRRKRTSSSGRKELQPSRRGEREGMRRRKGRGIPLGKAQHGEPRRCLKLRGCFETSQFHSSRPGPVPEDSARF